MEARATKALAVVGAAAAGVLALRALRSAAWWAHVALGPSLAEKFKGEYALVTGASEGIGLGIADALAKRGVNVVIVSRSEDKLARAAAHLRGRHPGVAVVTVAADAAAPGAAQKISKALDKAGVKDQVSLLVCNAGGGVSKAALYHEYTDKEEEAVRRLNGDASYALVKEMLPAMAKRGKGFILFISSLVVKMPASGISPYYLEKCKINALARVLQAEQDATGSGIAVQAHTLGAVVSPMLATVIAPDAAAAARAAAASGGTSNSASASASGSPTKGGGSGSASGSPTKAAGRGRGGSGASFSAPAVGWETQAVKPSFRMPSAATMGEWVVRAMGMGGAAVVTPYPGHALSEALALDTVNAVTWPPLRRALARRAHASMMSFWKAGKAGGGAAQGGAAAAAAGGGAVSGA